MELIRVTPQAYDAYFSEVPCFNKAAFNALNSDKCVDLHCLLFKDSKVRLGLVAGQQDAALASPFSAPFGGFSTLDSKIQVSYIEEAVDLLEQYAVAWGIKQISLGLPPLFYDQAFQTKVLHVLTQKGWVMQHLALNFFVDVSTKAADFRTNMTYSARKHLKVAMKHPFVVKKEVTPEALSLAYDIISVNRSIKGYSLSMTKTQLLETAVYVPIDAFLLYLQGNIVAAAIVYQVTSTVAMVIYWGDFPEFTEYRSMNYLTYSIMEHYRAQGFMVLDTGTAMLNNKPNYGLCVFKESIGCSLHPKSDFIKEFK